MRTVRTTLDVSGLPTSVFGHRGLVWWGAVAFMVIEGFTFALCIVSYLYLRRNFLDWPPPRTDQPDLLVPTIGVVLMLASNIPMHLVKEASHRYDRAAVIRWLSVCSVFCAAFLVVRYFDFAALNSRWDSHAYGSVVWTTVGFHTVILLIEVGETVGTLLLFLANPPVQKKHFTDADDNGLYWYFVTTSWAVLYVIVYLLPRWT